MHHWPVVSTHVREVNSRAFLWRSSPRVVVESCLSFKSHIDLYLSHADTVIPQNIVHLDIEELPPLGEPIDSITVCVEFIAIR